MQGKIFIGLTNDGCPYRNGGQLLYRCRGLKCGSLSLQSIYPWLPLWGCWYTAQRPWRETLQSASLFYVASLNSIASRARNQASHRFFCVFRIALPHDVPSGSGCTILMLVLLELAPARVPLCWSLHQQPFANHHACWQAAGALPAGCSAEFLADFQQISTFLPHRAKKLLVAADSAGDMLTPPGARRQQGAHSFKIAILPFQAAERAASASA